MKRSIFIATALASALAPVVLSAQKPAPPPSAKAEKCYGISKAGKNDCASTGNNSCGGTQKVDKDPKAWIMFRKDIASASSAAVRRRNNNPREVTGWPSQ